VVWFGLLSFLNEILVGPQGLLVLLSQQISWCFLDAPGSQICIQFCIARLHARKPAKAEFVYSFNQLMLVLLELVKCCDVVINTVARPVLYKFNSYLPLLPRKGWDFLRIYLYQLQTVVMLFKFNSIWIWKLLELHTFIDNNSKLFFKIFFV
jgi:hypothetical protein